MCDVSSFQIIDYVNSEPGALPIDELVKQILTIFQLFKNLLDRIESVIDRADNFSLSNVEHSLLNTLHFLKNATTQEFLYR